MKYILCGLLFVSFFISVNAQNKKIVTVAPKIDERIELTSIVSRLAGYGEYSQNIFKSYTADVDQYFGKYKNHAAVEFAKELREKNRIAFDAVPNFAIRLQTSPVLKFRVDFDKSGLDDDRWNKKDAEKFAVLLRKFYEETNFKKFFESHQPLYKLAEQRFQKILDQVNFAWYQEFYGEQPDGKYNLIIGLLNGGGNYGPKIVFPNGREDLFSIIGAWQFDEKGFPIFDDREFLQIVIHEFGHSFNNKLVTSNAAKFEKSSQIIFPQIAEEMGRQGYGKPLTVFIEGLLRSSVIKYFEKNPLEGMTTEQLIGYEEASSFVWTGKLFDLLTEYEKSRSKYPTLASFMPRIIEFFDDTATKIPEYKKILAAKKPKITTVSPLNNESKVEFATRASEVDENIQELRVAFNKQMADGIDYWMTDGKNPFIEPPVFDKDKKTLIGKVKLEPKSEYGIVLPVYKFRSFDSFRMPESYRIYFTTRGFTGTTTEKPVGYRIENEQITFVFNRPAFFKDEIKSVRVAGDFNNWNPQADGFELTKKDDDIYELSFKTDDIVKSGERKLFKFVINNNIWIEAPTRALNAVKDNGYLTLFLERK